MAMFGTLGEDFLLMLLGQSRQRLKERALEALTEETKASLGSQPAGTYLFTVKRVFTASHSGQRVYGDLDVFVGGGGDRPDEPGASKLFEINHVVVLTVEQHALVCNLKVFAG